MIDPSQDYSQAAAPILVIADEDGAARLGQDAIYDAGARCVGRVNFAGAHARLTEQAHLDGIMIEAIGADDEALADLLALCAPMTTGCDPATVVVTFAPAQTDIVAAALLGTSAQLLCDADAVDRTVALSAGMMTARRLHDPRRDESERLRALNSEVARIADTLARLTRSAGQTSAVKLAGLDYRGPSDDDEIAPVDATTVRAAIRARRLRANFFGADLFADPAWDMLLDLFAAELEFARVSVSSLCIAAAVPGTTALRWITTMLENGVFQRDPDPLDRRRAYISLSTQASENMKRYFSAIRRAGLASG